MYELQGTRYDPPPYLPARFKGWDDKKVDTSECMSGGGVEEEEKAPKAAAVVRSFLLAFQADTSSVKGAEESSPGRAGNEPRILDKERPKWHTFFDETGEAADKRVRGDMLRRSLGQLMLQTFRTVAAIAKDSISMERAHR